MGGIDFGIDDSRVIDLIVAWQESRAAGVVLTAEEICAATPELVEPVRSQIERLQRVERMLEGTLGQPPDGIRCGPAFPLATWSVPGFEILEELGRGGMGVVYKARQLNVGGRLVAIKTINAGPWGSRSLTERLRDEAQALGRLNHEHVVQVHDVIDRDDLLCLILEYVDGKSLAERTGGTAIDPREAARDVRTAASTMSEVHRAGILHRDLKPANILRDARGTIKITDFGLAKELAAETARSLTGDIAGSPSFMAPEQAQGRAKAVSERTDVYSLGATLYDLLTGRPPFAGATWIETLNQVQSCDPVAPRQLVPQIPIDLETICLKCLEKEPSKRYASAVELAADLDNFLAGRPVTARPITAMGRAWRWSKRHPDRASLVAAVVLAVAGLTGLGTWAATRIDATKTESEAAVKNEAVKAEAARLGKSVAELVRNSAERPPGWSWKNLETLNQQMASESVPLDDLTRTILRSEAAKALTAADLRPIQELVAGVDPYTLEFSPDGEFLVVGENTTHTGRDIVDEDRRLRTVADESNGATPVPEADLDRQLLQIAVFNLQTGCAERSVTFKPSLDALHYDKLDGVRAMAFTPDGSRLYVGTRSGWMHAFRWTEPGRARWIGWYAHGNYIHRIRFHPEWPLLWTGSKDQHVKVFDLEGIGMGHYIHSCPIEDLALITNREYSHELRAVIAGKQSAFLNGVELKYEAGVDNWDEELGLVATNVDQRSVIGGSGTTFFSYDRTNRTLLRTLRDYRKRQNHTGKLDSLEISANGQWLASSSRDELKLWDLPSGRVVAAVLTGGNGRHTLRFHPTKPQLAICTGGRVKLFELAHRGIWQTHLAQSYEWTQGAISRDGSQLAASGEVAFEEGKNGSMILIKADKPSGSRLEIHTPVNTIVPSAVAPDGNTNVVISPYLGRYWINNLDLQRPVREGWATPEGEHPVYAPDGERLYFSGRPRSAEGLEPYHHVMALDLANEHSEARPIWNNKDSHGSQLRSRVLALVAGRKYVACSAHDGRICLIDADKETELAVAEPESLVDALALAPDEQSLVAGTQQGELLVLNAPNLSERQTVAAHDSMVRAVTFAGPDLVVSAGGNADLKLWRFHGGGLEELLTLTGLSGQVIQLSATDDGTKLAILLKQETAVRLLRIDLLRIALRKLKLDW